MTATTLGQIAINDKLRSEIQIIARSAFDLTGNSAAMRLPGRENLFSSPPGSAAIRADQKLRS
jgi:hypothetical protein